MKQNLWLSLAKFRLSLRSNFVSVMFIQYKRMLHIGYKKNCIISVRFMNVLSLKIGLLKKFCFWTQMQIKYCKGWNREIRKTSDWWLFMIWNVVGFWGEKRTEKGRWGSEQWQRVALPLLLLYSLLQAYSFPSQPRL